MIQTKQIYRIPKHANGKRIIFFSSFIMFSKGHSQIITIVFRFQKRNYYFSTLYWMRLFFDFLSFIFSQESHFPTSNITNIKSSIQRIFSSSFLASSVYSLIEKKMYSNWLHFQSHWIFCVILIIHGNVHTIETQAETEFSFFFCLYSLWFSMTINFSVGFSNGKSKRAEKNEIQPFTWFWDTEKKHQL